MPVRSDSPAPYAPPATVLAVINGFRDRGLATPFTPEVLLRAGVSESLVQRTLKSLEGLDLIDEAGNPTAQLDGLRRAKTDELKARLEEVVRSAYAEVFQFTDPATDDATRVADAFRSYEPIGQRGRMVTLFMGLCEAAGIVSEGTARKSATPTAPRLRATRPNVLRKPEPAYRPPSVGGTARVRTDGGGFIPAAIQGLIASLPPEGQSWTKAQHDKFLTVFGTVLDFVYPVSGTVKGENDDDR